MMEAAALQHCTRLQAGDRSQNPRLGSHLLRTRPGLGGLGATLSRLLQLLHRDTLDSASAWYFSPAILSFTQWLGAGEASSEMRPLVKQLWICHIIAGLNAHSCELSCSVTLQHCSTAALSANTASPKYTPKVCQANLYQLDNNPSGGGHFCSAACWAPACCRIMQNCLKLQVIHHGATTAAPPACNYCRPLQAAAHRPPLSAIFAIAGKTAVAVLQCCSAAVISVYVAHSQLQSLMCPVAADISCHHHHSASQIFRKISQYSEKAPSRAPC